jgi:putative resolvase
VGEVGSGVNGRRPRLARLLGDPEVATIVVEHRERLARFGVTATKQDPVGEVYA